MIEINILNLTILNMEKYNFIYITTNLINKKQYIGDHSTNNIEKDIYYMGSGDLIYKAIKKYGKENFYREILEFFITKQEAFDAQEKYIKECNTLTPNGYNISPSGGHGTNGGYLSEESKEKIRRKKLGVKLNLTPEQRLNRSKKLKGKNKGKKHTEEQNRKQSERQLGKKQSEETKKKRSESMKGKNKGRVHSSEICQHMSIAHIGIKDSEKTKNKKSESMKGKNVGSLNGQVGKVWITKENETKTVLKTELNTWIQNDWVKGRKLTYIKL
jgi:hypothetical protein